MNDRTRRLPGRILVCVGIVLVLVALGACGLPGYHFPGGTTPWLPGGAPSPHARRKRSQAPSAPPQAGQALSRGTDPRSSSLRSLHET